MHTRTDNYHSSVVFSSVGLKKIVFKNRPIDGENRRHRFPVDDMQRQSSTENDRRHLKGILIQKID